MSVFPRATYPVKNGLVWKECESIMNSKVVLFGQLNNMSTPKVADLRHRLRDQSLYLRFPKPSILRAYLRQSQWSSLEPAVVGPTFCAISRAEPSQLRDALKTLQAEKNIVLLGGKLVGREFTVEGVREVVEEMPSLEVMRGQMVGLMEAAGLGLVQTLGSAPTVFTATLQQIEH